MRTPNQLEAERIAAEESCPVCRADLQVQAHGSYIDCVDETCNWVGWCYDFIGPHRMKEDWKLKPE